MSEVTKRQRQFGKIQELALQFLGGVGALKGMALNFGIKLNDESATKLRDSWRSANPWARSIGDKMNRAAMLAVKNPDREFTAGRVTFCASGDWLWCELPSKRLLAYYQPRIKWTLTPWDEEILALECLWGSARPKFGKKWTRRFMHGGVFLENFSQAVGADLLRHALVNCERAGINTLLSVHDEILVEGYKLPELSAAMLDVPSWADGLPVEGDGGTGERYGK
jgi:DNA polymerase